MTHQQAMELIKFITSLRRVPMNVDEATGYRKAQRDLIRAVLEEMEK